MQIVLSSDEAELCSNMTGVQEVLFIKILIEGDMEGRSTQACVKGRRECLQQDISVPRCAKVEAFVSEVHLGPGSLSR